MILEPISKRHDRSRFDCGKPALNAFLARSARQYDGLSSRTFVLTTDGRTVIGYFSLSSHAVYVPDVPSTMRTGFGDDHMIPAVLLGRLAIAKDRQGEGLGRRLLAEAMRYVLDVALKIGVHLVVLDALDDEAVSFYTKFGFEAWPANGRKMFARVADLAALFSSE